MAEYAERPVEGDPVAVAAHVEAHPDVGLLVVVGLDEAHGDDPRPPRERAPEHRAHGLGRQVVDGGGRRDGVREHERVRLRPPRLALEEREPADGRAVPARRRRSRKGYRHVVADAAARRHDPVQRGGVELPRDRQAKLGLVPPHGGLHVRVERVRRLALRRRRPGHGHVAEPRQVALELGEARDVAASAGVQQLLEGAPRGAAVLPVHRRRHGPVGGPYVDAGDDAEGANKQEEQHRYDTRPARHGSIRARLGLGCRGR
ncbi:hypothetical protein BDA96_01G323800 [Sorghum bicolor]|uniref:Uncharacterized protein n=1 Tax=Sorghum bicolor TaxID=4558 RepID=A0A921V0K9_SORBI|nr:hypothetical protein BDA96_01G323800 [Sorghum bicolor]